MSGTHGDPKRSVRLVGALESFEGYPELKKALEGFEVEIQTIHSSSIALETQQLDEVAQKQRLEQTEKELQEMINSGVKTSPTQIFLLNVKGLAQSDEVSQATMRALVKATMLDKDNVVAAFMPGNKDNDDQQELLSESMRSAVNHFLTNLNIKTAASLEDLAQLLG